MPAGCEPSRHRLSSRPTRRATSTHLGQQQRQERVRGRAAEQLDHAGVGAASAGPGSRRGASGSPGPPRPASRRRTRSARGASSVPGAAAELAAAQLPQRRPGAGLLDGVRVVELGGQHRGHAEREDVAVALGRQRVELGDERDVATRPTPGAATPRRAARRRGAAARAGGSAGRGTGRPARGRRSPRSEGGHGTDLGTRRVRRRGRPPAPCGGRGAGRRGVPTVTPSALGAGATGG